MSEPAPEFVETLFQEAIDLPPEQRRAFLDERCAGDAALRAAVEELLQFDAKAQSEPAFLRSPVTLPGEAPLPAQLGRYRVLRLLGEGGMGAVYEAEQDNPRRRVALKMIRPGLLSPQLLKRFGKEAQILGRLHHPGIASVYEAGIAEDGRPFFAMELIAGLPLDAYARLHGLAAAARLELFARVCDAVQHAHEHGVIHRDLKPSNILVDEAGQPKVLDFGVAHATDADLQTTTGRTESGQLLGTLSYMSPEQVAGDVTALDQRSDVYTLGVILFELLAGRLPYPLEHLPLLEVARVIREREPSRLGSVDARFRGDVETIVGKALAKDKARRYASARELAQDIRRYLASEPIQARPPSALYQLRKFARRHKALVAGVLGVFAALLVGTVVSVLFALRAAENAAVAAENAAVAQEKEREATFQTYRARLAAAVAALSNNDVADAARQLDAAPKALRGWEWRHLSSRLDDSAEVLRFRPGDPTFLLWGPEGVRVGILTSTGLRFRDESGREFPERPFLRFANWLSVRGGPATEWFFADWENRRLVRLRDETGRVIGTIKPRIGEANVAALSPDRKRAAVALVNAGPSRIGIYDTSSGEERAACTDFRDMAYALAFSPDGRRLAAGGDDKVIHIWDAATGKQLARCEGHTSKILSIAFRQDGSQLVTAAHDGTVRQWDARSGEQVEPPYDRHTAEVLAAVYSPDGQRVASAGADRIVRLWWAKGRHDQAVLRGHTGTVVALAFSKDGRRLVSASYDVPLYQGDGTVRFWEAAPEATLPVLAGHTLYVYPVAYSPDGRWIASGAWDQTIRLWDAATSELCAPPLRHTDVVRVLAFTPDVARLVSGGGNDNQLLVWDLFNGRISRRVTLDARVESVAVSPDGARIAAGNYNAKAGFTIWDVATGRKIGTGTGVPFAFSPDGKWLAGRDADGKTVVLWDAHTFRPVAHWQEHTGEINAVAFDRDGGRLVSASSDRTVRLWDVATGECLRKFEGHTDEVFTAVFHPDGPRIASGGRDRAVWLWDVASGKEVAHLPGHTSYIWSLAFSPDGKTLVSGSGDSTVRLWDTEPLRVRYQARRKAAALRPEAEELVARLFREKQAAAAVVAALRGDGTLSEPLRHAAVRAVLRREQVAAYREMSLAAGCVLRLLQWGVPVPLPYCPEM